MRLGKAWRRKADALREYCRAGGYDDSVAIMIDYSRHSGRRRFVVWGLSLPLPWLTG